MATTRAIKAALQTLAESDNYRVLKRLPVASFFNPLANDDEVVGIVLDVETTGLDSDIDQVIELGMIKFSFTRSGTLGRILDTYASFNDPGIEIPEEITRLTGITPADVRGHRIMPSGIEKFVQEAALIVAHNASFDRPFIEKLFPSFSDFYWACSATEIDWRNEGMAGSRLEYIANSFGFFYNAHRAVDDCNALVNILSFKLPRSKQRVFAKLLDAARRTDLRIFADGAPYGDRKALKQLGYRWNDGQDGFPRAWWKDVPPAEADEELAKISRLEGQGLINPKLFRMTGKNRFRRALQPLLR